jgi:hypothetical protein
VPGIRTGQGGYSWAKPEEGYGAVRAIDPTTGAMRWEFKMSDLTWAGVMTTASNVLFSGSGEGYFFALDARNGNLLWKTQLGSVVRSGADELCRERQTARRGRRRQRAVRLQAARMIGASTRRHGGTEENSNPETQTWRRFRWPHCGHRGKKQKA